MTSCLNSITIGISLVVLGSIFTWNNEANKVCTSGAYDVASAKTHELKSCSMEKKKIGSFMHLTCPVEESLETTESSTGIGAKGAYKLTFLTEQYGYRFTSSTQMAKKCDSTDADNCIDKKESCSCIKLDWATTLPVNATAISAYNGTWCDSCVSDVKKLDGVQVPYYQILNIASWGGKISDEEKARSFVDSWLALHPAVEKEGWNWIGTWDSHKEEDVSVNTYESVFHLFRFFEWGNTPATKLGSTEKLADYVPLGDGTLKIDSKNIPLIRDQQPVPVTNTPDSIEQNSFVHLSPSKCGQKATSYSDCYYSKAETYYDGNSEDEYDTPSVGDIRMIVQAFGSKTISALGKQVVVDDTIPNLAEIKAESFGKSRIPPCKARSIFYAANGEHSRHEIFKALQDGLEAQTKFFRFLTFMLIGLGFHVAFFSIQDISNSVPVIGPSLASLVGFVLHIFTVLLTATTWFTVFALSWVFYRPGYGMFLFTIAGSFLLASFYLLKKNDNGSSGHYGYGLLGSSDY